MLVILKTTLLLQVAVHLSINNALRKRHGDLGNHLLDQLVAGFLSLGEHTLAMCLLLEVIAEFLDGVELARDLSKVIVSLGKLAFFHAQNCHLNKGCFTFTISTEQY